MQASPLVADGHRTAERLATLRIEPPRPPLADGRSCAEVPIGSVDTFAGRKGEYGTRRLGGRPGSFRRRFAASRC